MVSADAVLSVVIANYRRADLLERALHALRRSERGADEVIVVDVAPVQPLAPELASAAQVVSIEGNPGYSAACNHGAVHSRGDWLLFLNADVFVDPSCIGGVLEAIADHPDIGIATCRLLLEDGSLDHACHRGLPSVADSLAYKARLDRVLPNSRRLGHYRLSWLDPLGSHDVEACSGAFLLIRREAFEAACGWDEAYRFYGEDLDLCARVAAAGWRIRYVGTETATHLKGGSSHFRHARSELTAEERATQRHARAAVIESHQRFYLRHMEQGTARPLRPLVHLVFAGQRRLAARAST